MRRHWHIHFYKQRQSKISIKQMLSNTSSLNFCYLKTIRILHQRYHSKVIGHILKNKQKNKCVCIHHIIRLIKMKMKNRSHSYDINRSKSRYSTYKKCLKMLLVYVLSNTLAQFEALFMKKLSNIDAELNESVACIKKRVFVYLYLEIGSIRLLFHFILALQLPCNFYL